MSGPGVNVTLTTLSRVSVPALYTPFPVTSLKATDVTHPPALAVSAKSRVVAGPTVTTKLSGLFSPPNPCGGVCRRVYVPAGTLKRKYPLGLVGVVRIPSWTVVAPNPTSSGSLAPFLFASLNT
jgi:hypothetical protein